MPVNKRLDEWVTEERIDFTKLEQPRKDAKTPVKDGKAMNGSRPSSPDKEVVRIVFLLKLFSFVYFASVGINFFVTY